jgi:hypothetical protein
MIHEFFNGQFNTAMHINLFKKLLACCIVISMSVYIIIHLILFDFPLEWLEEVITLVKILLTGSIFAGIISGILLTADLVEHIIKTRQWQLYKIIPLKKIAFSLLIMVAVISVCSAQTLRTGMVKDAGTGLTASYKNLKPGKVLLLMNNEILHHTDIPLGESFLLVNKGIKGFTVKNGKVSAGCALTIKNKAGKIMLQSNDLFKGNDTFNKDSIDFLRCTVYTGEPMKWEEKYDVTVIFWDKYGSGKIENKVTIRCIDIP